jgi:hypothetical protein
LHHRGPALVVTNDQNKLFIRGDCPSNSTSCTPLKQTEADQFASTQYNQYRESGFVNLQPGMRLHIVAPVMRGGAEPQMPLTEPDSGGAASSTITARASRDLLGYETARYILRPASGGRVMPKLESIDVEPLEKVAPADLKRTDYMEDVPKEGFFRLYFQLRHAMKDHNTVLLVSGSEGALNEASGAFEEDPDAYCSATHAGTTCIAFPKFTAVSAEIKVYVKKHAVYVPLSGRVSDALISAGIHDPNSIARKLRVERVWDSRLVPVKFDSESVSLLRLPLVGGDRITF